MFWLFHRCGAPCLIQTYERFHSARSAPVRLPLPAQISLAPGHATRRGSSFPPSPLESDSAAFPLSQRLCLSHWCRARRRC